MANRDLLLREARLAERDSDNPVFSPAYRALRAVDARRLYAEAAELDLEAAFERLETVKGGAVCG